ncbi:hypothetical protein BASA81_006234 [Batrachochytrium salamandrivorans]|nr:hypothetical protein BASA81_006234 [Batrachochytrium salamandrivorans]
MEQQLEQQLVQQLPQSDPALEAFDRLRSKRVQAQDDHTASTFLAEFQSTAASLKPDERIKLVVSMRKSGVELLKAVLADPQANKICSLQWTYYGKEDVTPIIPLLINNCPELASLRVEFVNRSTFDFLSSLLEHTSNKLKVLDMPKYTKGDIPRFFAALGQSQVSALTLSIHDSPEFAQGLHEYLARDLLVRFKVWMKRKQVPPELLMSLSKCTRLAKLEMLHCKFSQPTAFTHLPKSITKLALYGCTFVGGFDWSFLADSNVRELDFDRMKEVDGNQFGGALAAHLRAKGLDTLRLSDRSFADETLAAAGVEIGRIKILDFDCNLNDASIELISLTLQSPNNAMKELVLEYTYSTMSGIEGHLVPALEHPNCDLVKLSFWVYEPEHEEAAKRVKDMFYNRLVLFVLLQGRQVGRLYCPLRRLPVEMFRLVGAVLI